MAKAKYYSGDPDKIWNSPVDRVLTTYDYENFSNEYDRVFIELNKKDKK